jgi:hypothetical protein
MHYNTGYVYPTTKPEMEKQRKENWRDKKCYT